MFTILLSMLHLLHHFSRNGNYRVGIQALSRASYAKFQNFQAPHPFSRSFQGLEKREKFSRTFKEEWSPSLTDTRQTQHNKIHEMRNCSATHTDCGYL